jgi:diaminopimelate decarboxylase
MQPTTETTLLDLLPDSAAITGGELTIGGLRATELVERFGTPLVVYDEATVRAQAQAYRAAAPDALLVYGSKAFPSVAMLALLAEEGFGADVSTSGELAFALAAGVAGEQIVVHGNNKEDALLTDAGKAGALVVLDSIEEIGRARHAGCTRFLVRVTPGIDADTHEAVRTAHHGSKFGLPPDDAVEALRLVPECEGLHVHVGSQLTHFGASLETVEWLGRYAARLHAELGWEARIIDLGGGLGVRHVTEEPVFTIGEFVSGLLGEFDRAWEANGLARPRVAFEPGRSLVARAAVTLYTVGAIKTVGAATTFVTVDGGMSDNPRPALYGARYTALLANRADEAVGSAYAVAGKHCESGDVLIDRVKLPAPRRGDILAVPVTGAYTLSMSSTYNAVPRPAAVLVSDGEVRLIRRRETIGDLLALEA